MLYMLGISAAVLALSYMGKLERDRVEAVEAASEEALRVAMIPDGYHPGATVEFELSSAPVEGEALSEGELQGWFDREWDAQMIADCMISWWMVDPQISGEISIEVIYDSEGPQILRVLRFSELPPTASSCITAAINGLGWPASAEGAVVRFTASSQREIVAPNMGSVLEVVESG
jgi:hypothetical protein